MSKSFSERVEEAKAVVESVSPVQAGEQAGQPGVVFVDPRPAEAIASTTGLIPGAERVSLDDIAAGKLPQALSDRATHVITSCQGGPMGAIAAHELVKQGFEHVRYIEGGTQGWLDAGLQTVR